MRVYTLFVASALLAVIACGAPPVAAPEPSALLAASPSPTPAPSPTPTPTPTLKPTPAPTPTPSPLINVSLSFGAGVSEEQQQIIKEGLGRAQAFISEVTGAPPPRVAVKVIASKVTGIDPRQSGSCCNAPPGEILIDLDNADFAVSREAYFSKTAWLRHHVIHEYAHVWQQAQPGDPSGCIGRPSFDGAGSRTPQWFIEGFAQFAAFDTLARDGIVPREVSARYTALQLSGTAPADLPLRVLESSRTQAAYQAGYFANTLLARRGLAPFARFCADAAAGQPWRAAFATAFGTDVDSFYAEADRYILEVRQAAR